MAEGAGAAGLARHAGQAGALPRPQGRADPVRRQHRSAHSRLGHGARARARGPHRLVPADHSRPARRARADRDPARASSAPTFSRSTTGGCSSTCRPRAPSSTSRSRRATGRMRRRFSGRWRPTASSRCGSTRRPRWSEGRGSGSCARRNFALRSSASAAFRSPSTCTASARRSSSWCAPRARCTRSRTAPGARKRVVLRPLRCASDPEYDTEAVYFELLREIGRSVELRVVVDIIAGASAGGINGTMLARALSHDLPMDSAARSVARQRRRRRAAVARGARRPVEQVVPQAVHLGRRRDRPVPHRSRTWRCARSCRCSCARAGSSRRSTAASWPA